MCGKGFHHRADRRGPRTLKKDGRSKHRFEDLVAPCSEFEIALAMRILAKPTLAASQETTSTKIAAPVSQCTESNFQQSLLFLSLS